MKEIYGTIKMPVSMKCKSVKEGIAKVNEHNVQIRQLEFNGEILHVHDFHLEWENAFDEHE